MVAPDPAAGESILKIIKKVQIFARLDRLDDADPLDAIPVRSRRPGGDMGPRNRLPDRQPQAAAGGSPAVRHHRRPRVHGWVRTQFEPF